MAETGASTRAGYGFRRRPNDVLSSLILTVLPFPIVFLGRFYLPRAVWPRLGRRRWHFAGWDQLLPLLITVLSLLRVAGGVVRDFGAGGYQREQVRVG